MNVIYNGISDIFLLLHLIYIKITNNLHDSKSYVVKSSSVSIAPRDTEQDTDTHYKREDYKN